MKSPTKPPSPTQNGQLSGAAGSRGKPRAASSASGRRHGRHPGPGERPAEDQAHAPTAAGSAPPDPGGQPEGLLAHVGDAGAEAAERIGARPADRVVERGIVGIVAPQAPRRPAAASASSTAPSASAARRARNSETPPPIGAGSSGRAAMVRMSSWLRGARSRDQVGERRLGGRQIMHQGDPDRARPGVRAGRVGTAEIAAGQNLERRLGPQPPRRGLAVADVQPQEEAAVRPLVAETTGRDIVRRGRTSPGRGRGWRSRAPRPATARSPPPAPAAAGPRPRSCAGGRSRPSTAGSPATKPERRPAALERLESEWQTITLSSRPSRAERRLERADRRVGRVDLRIAFVDHQQEARSGARARSGAGDSRDRRPRPAGWPASRDRTRRCARAARARARSSAGR